MARPAKRNRGRVIILSGPSGAGKSTLHDKLLSSSSWRQRIVRSISATTRSPRGQEKNGVDYLFMSPAMFAYKAKAGHFLEWAKVFNNCYGTPLKNVRDHLRNGRSVLLCIDVQGGKMVKTRIPDAVMIFIKTSTREDLRRRLSLRGTDSPESVELRLKTAEQELKQAAQYRHVIVNDDLAEAFTRLENVLRAEGL